MFNAWKKEKAVAALVDEAQALADRLADAKPHIVDRHFAAVQFWHATHLAMGQNLLALTDWTPVAIARYVTAAQTRIATLRKQRFYDSSDGLTIWLHTARAVAEPRIAPPVREIWLRIFQAGPNADGMANDLLQEAGLPLSPVRRVPNGFGTADLGSGAA